MYKLTEVRQVRPFFYLCWVTYFSTYLGRLNLSACMSQIATVGEFPIATLGLAGSAFFAAYGVFQLVFGVLGDRLNPRWIVFCGIFCSGLINLAVACTTAPTVLVLLWMCNGMVQAAVWSPLLRLTVDMLPPEQALHASVRYSTTLPFGTFAAYLISAAAIRLAHWRVAFAISGCVLVVISMAWLGGIGYLCRSSHKQAAGQTDSHPKPVPLRAVYRLLPHTIRYMLLWAACGAVLHGLLKDSLQTWMPTMLGSCFGLPPAFSIVITLIIPIVNLGGVYLGKLAYERIFHSELATAAAAFGVAGLLFVLLRFSLSSFWAVVCIFAISSALMLSVNVMLVTLIPLRLQSYGCISTVSGMLNSAAYVGSTISGYGISLLLEHTGWTTTVLLWAVVASCGALICYCAHKRLRQPGDVS